MKATVTCYVCKREVAVEDGRFLQGKIVCSKHTGGKGTVVTIREVKPGAHKYVRMDDGTLLISSTNANHKQMAKSHGGKASGAGIIGVYSTGKFETLTRGSTSLRLPSLPDDEDFITLHTGLAHD